MESAECALRANCERKNVKLVFRLIPALAISLSDGAVDGQENPSLPKQQYSAVFKQYSLISGGLRNAKTDLDRKAAVERMSVFSAKFLDVAAKYPNDAIALTALRQAVQVIGSTDSAALQTWEMNTSDFPAGSTDESASRTVELVLRDHVLSEKLGPVIDRMRYGYRLQFDACLRTVLEKNPHHDVQGLSCLALAQFLNDKLRMLQLVDDRPELAQCCDIVFGKDYLPALKEIGRADLAARIEVLFQLATKEYADVKFRAGTVGQAATSELYAIRHLSVGRVAPDIEGQDQDGVGFKTSDYHGKVVLLYFWSEF